MAHREGLMYPLVLIYQDTSSLLNRQATNRYLNSNPEGGSCMTSTSQPVTNTWWPATTNALDAALAAHHAGLCVIPLNGKRPALGGWKQYQKQRPGEQDIRRWAQEGLLQNLGIVCGAVSNNLTVLDFDGPGAYGAFAALFPPLTQSFTVATGSGKGKHVYLYVDALPPTTRALDTPIGHIELRAEGTYVVAPPSIHPVTKARYVVEKPLAILRVADLDKLVRWIEAFKPTAGQQRPWQPPRHLPSQDGAIVPFQHLPDRMECKLMETSRP
jgi:hypothetical protein